MGSVYSQHLRPVIAARAALGVGAAGKKVYGIEGRGADGRQVRRSATELGVVVSFGIMWMLAYR